VLSLAVVGWECLFPLAFLLPWPYGIGFLAAGALFHAANAILMGLNTLFLSFLATYPALLYWLNHKGW
jgi:hypothetical protein